MKKVEKKGNITKTGFSTAGFGCCGHHKICDMGRKECYYADSDPEVKELCSCYKRNTAERKLGQLSLFEIEKLTEKIGL